MAGGNGVTADPNAINAFAQGVGGTTVTLINQTLNDLPKLTAQLAAGATSMLSEGQSFQHRHLDLAEQFRNFFLDATAGVGALATGADTIALNLTGTDDANARNLLRDVPAPGSSARLLGLVAAGGTPHSTLTPQDVLDVFNPGAQAASPLLNTLHAEATARPPATPFSRPGGGPAGAVTAAGGDPPIAHLGRWIVLNDGEPVWIPADSVSPTQLAKDGRLADQTGPEKQQALADRLNPPHGDATPPNPNQEPAAPTAVPS